MVADRSGNQLVQPFGGAFRKYVVKLGNQVEQWAGDVLQIHRPSIDQELTFLQQVFLIEITDKPDENLGRKRNPVDPPQVKGLVEIHKILIENIVV